MKTVAIIGTFDTKGEEFAYVASRFKELGVNTLTIHCGVFDPQTMPDVPNTEVTAAIDIDLSAVSYTHLDVYKRQAPSWSLSRSACLIEHHFVLADLCKEAFACACGGHDVDGSVEPAGQVFLEVEHLQAFDVALLQELSLIHI